MCARAYARMDKRKDTTVQFGVCVRVVCSHQRRHAHEAGKGEANGTSICKQTCKVLMVRMSPGELILQTAVPRRKRKIGPTKKFVVHIFSSLGRVYISSSTPSTPSTPQSKR